MSEAPLPPDIPGESEPPNLRLAVIVVIALLKDLDGHLLEGTGESDDLHLRLLAVLAVLRRVHDNLGGDDGSE